MCRATKNVAIGFFGKTRKLHFAKPRKPINIRLFDHFDGAAAPLIVSSGGVR